MTPEEYAKGLMANGYSGGSLTDFLSFKGIAKYSNEFSKYNLNFVSGIEINLVEKKSFLLCFYMFKTKKDIDLFCL